MKKRTILLTGASRGIGKAIFNKLQKDYEIIAPTRRELDLSDNKSIDVFIKNNKNAKIDIIINNAGINFPQWIEEMSDENIESTIQINLIAPIRLIRGFVGNMKKNKWGKIINVSSAFGIVARGKQTLYAATKHGINGVTKALALELAKDNILVNSVCPGFTKTDLVVKKNSPEKIALLEKDIPLGRLAEPEEIANLVAFLISSDNTYITGSSIIIDGGFVSK
ncbi:MAG: SDR family oxidoreductase [Actinobacteria bacterium]|nr:SDR family oxidoreductase [Actinomycetota bacterium]